MPDLSPMQHSFFVPWKQGSNMGSSSLALQVAYLIAQAGKMILLHFSIHCTATICLHKTVPERWTCYRIIQCLTCRYNAQITARYTHPRSHRHKVIHLVSGHVEGGYRRPPRLLVFVRVLVEGVPTENMFPLAGCATNWAAGNDVLLLNAGVVPLPAAFCWPATVHQFFITSLFLKCINITLITNISNWYQLHHRSYTTKWLNISAHLQILYITKTWFASIGS